MTDKDFENSLFEDFEEIGYIPEEFKKDSLQEDQKVYDITINQTPIIVDAGTMFLASKRAKAYLKCIEKRTRDKTGNNRWFWADIIMLNIITNKMLKSINPYQLERLLKPLNYSNKGCNKNEKKD